MKTLEVVCGIIKEENGYLIAKRKSNVHNAIWEFPGGKVEAGESREDAIVRELKEELNYTCRVVRYLMSVVDERADVCIHVHAYLCEKISGELEKRAHSEVQWVAASQLASYTFEPSDYAIIDALMKVE